LGFDGASIGFRNDGYKPSLKGLFLNQMPERHFRQNYDISILKKVQMGSLYRNNRLSHRRLPVSKTIAFEQDQSPNGLGQVNRNRSEIPVIDPPGIGYTVQTRFDRRETVIEVSGLFCGGKEGQIERIAAWRKFYA
jgi:hypothetical protein